MAKRVTQSDIENMNNLYLKYGTYAEVARQTGFSASTVSKYIIKDYAPAAVEIKEFDMEELPPVNVELFRVPNWGQICQLSHEEKDEIRNVLWKEMVI